MRFFTILAFCGSVSATTLEKLSVEQMAEKSSLIVRGRVVSCGGEQQGSVIYTRCRVAVSERWKGASPAQVDFVVPGGNYRGITQTFTGAPNFRAGDEHVLFLWIGKSGTPRVIGLSQGDFSLKTNSQGGATAKREATSERMLNAEGLEVRDEPVEVDVTQLRERVRRALGAAK